MKDWKEEPYWSPPLPEPRRKLESVNGNISLSRGLNPGTVRVAIVIAHEFKGILTGGMLTAELADLTKELALRHILARLTKAETEIAEALRVEFPPEVDPGDAVAKAVSENRWRNRDNQS